MKNNMHRQPHKSSPFRVLLLLLLQLVENQEILWDLEACPFPLPPRRRRRRRTYPYRKLRKDSFLPSFLPSFLYAGLPLPGAAAAASESHKVVLI